MQDSARQGEWTQRRALGDCTASIGASAGNKCGVVADIIAATVDIIIIMVGTAAGTGTGTEKEKEVNAAHVATPDR